MIVMKFGGTSVEDATAMRAMCDIVKSRAKRKPIVVLSACSGVTNTLIQCAELASTGREADAQNLLKEKISDRHIDIVQGLLTGLREQDRLIREISIYTDELRHLLYGISITGDLSPRVLDFVMSYGERLSTTIAVAALREMGLRAGLVDARRCVVTNSAFGKAEPDLKATGARCEEHLISAADRGELPVTQGFIAADARGITTTLGRGGSDFSAAIIGAVLNADDIEIWTDVDGILTADPKLVLNALRVKEMSFQEASELAYFGAKVLHPSTLLPAIEKNIPVHIYNSRRPDAGGTLIKPRVTASHVAVKSISSKRGITVLNITSTRMLGSYGFMKKIFDIFHEHHTSVDLVTTSEVSVSLSIDYSPDLDALLAHLEEFGRVQVQRNKAIVCIVGEKLKSEKGIAARVFGRLREVPIDMISQGASEINITFVIDEEHVPHAVRELHDEFFAGVKGKGVFE
ncbi:MAG: lysine-sensitive aspartokinase 3 [Ignavibacteriae bacterium]|nr:lysine-sensitive aspartokinase 3 [Ignavibacteriota bacterium]